MLTYNQEFRRVLEGMLESELETQTDFLSNGTALDFPEYKWRCGVIYGLRKALETCEEAETALNKRS